MNERNYRFGPDYEESVRLRDGTEAVLRMIRPSDKELLLEGFERLSPDSRYMRFLAPKKRLTDDELRYLTDVDGNDHFALVAVRTSALGKDEGLGVGRFVRLGSEPEAAEPAITVVDDCQGKGLGTILLRKLIAASWERGIRSFRCWVLLDNSRVRDLFRDVGTDIRVEEVEDDAVVVTFPIEGPVDVGQPLRPLIRKLLSDVARGLVSVLPAPLRSGTLIASGRRVFDLEERVMTEVKSGSVKENVEHELKSLRSDLKQIADEIGNKIDQAGRDAKETWKRLESERERFVQQVEEAAEETTADLRQMGADLKQRLQSLRDELKTTDLH